MCPNPQHKDGFCTHGGQEAPIGTADYEGSATKLSVLLSHDRHDTIYTIYYILIYKTVLVAALYFKAEEDPDLQLMMDGSRKQTVLSTVKKQSARPSQKSHCIALQQRPSLSSCCRLIP